MWVFALALWLVNTIYSVYSIVPFAISQFPVSEWWGTDAYRVYDASKNLLDGHSYYSDSSFLYSPLAVLLGAPAALIPSSYAVLALAFVKVVLAIAVTYWVTRGSWLAILLVLTSLPVLNDVMLGNLMIPVAASMAVATFGAPRRRSGIALGIVAAAIAKPLLAPYFIWLLVYRRKAAEGAIATGIVATLLTAAGVGPGAYVDWIKNLLHGTSLLWAWNGNSGLSAYAPALVFPVAVVVMLLTLLVVARASETRSLVWVLAAGILVSPYAVWYSAVPLLLIFLVLRPWPRVYGLAMMQPLASTSIALLGGVAMLAGPPGALAGKVERPGPKAAGLGSGGTDSAAAPLPEPAPGDR